MVFPVVALLGLVATITGLLLIIHRQLLFFKRLGIPCLPTKLPAGNLQGVGSNLHICELFQRFYLANKHRGPFLGLYFFLTRVVLIMDLDLVRNILVKDSHLFLGRRHYYNERDDPLSAHLFNVNGPKWKTLRTKLTPTFTSGKMKFMFGTMVEVSERLRGRLDELADQPSVEVKNIWSRFSTDVIGSCAFGIECNTLNEENAKFNDMGRLLFDKPLHSMMIQMMLTQMKSIGNFFRIRHLNIEAADFFHNIVKQTIRYRETTTNKVRGDFMNILLDLKNNPSTMLTNDEIAAQALLFFAAGFETSSSLLSFCSYELALQQEIQSRARQEVNEMFARHKGKLTYEALLELKYCEQILKGLYYFTIGHLLFLIIIVNCLETLRKYPPVATLSRTSNKSYPVSGTNFVIPGDMSVLIPTYAIHHDPDIYPDPEKFDPERFTADQIGARHSAAFLPFGDGPHNCIGIRFGMMQARIGLITLLKNFQFTPDPQMIIPLKLSKWKLFLASDDGIRLNIKRLAN